MSHYDAMHNPTPFEKNGVDCSQHFGPTGPGIRCFIWRISKTHFISAAESRDKSLYIKFTVDSGCKAYYIRQQRIPQSLNRTDFRKIKIIWTDTHLIVMNTMFGVVLELYCLWCLSSVLSGKYGGMCLFYNFSKVPWRLICTLFLWYLNSFWRIDWSVAYKFF